MGMAKRQIGSLEVGKKADIVLHDTDLPEWGPVFDAPGQLALERAAQRRPQRLDRRRAGAGRRPRRRMLDEAKMLADARQAGLRADRPHPAAEQDRMAGGLTTGCGGRPALRAPTPAEWRAAMGCFPSGVTIVTTWDGDEPVGSTINAFCSVSLTPPLLLICLDLT